MKWLQKLLELFTTQSSFLKNIFILLVITRLMFLENNQLALIAEIIGGLVFLMAKEPNNNQNN
ncbi:MAG: hypothetical protein FJX70_07370 [Alphaproteobacteria bacterium]|jgi:hypothetical protein|nr:hypothetical protein [Alphaproteobacteria bacterium]WPX99511.1 hypothetical protein Megpolyxen_01402 [Candidatus Megaera polyxenophila]